MSLSLKTTLSLCASTVLAVWSIGSAHAQQARVVCEKPAYDELLSPEFSGGKQKSGFKPKNWLEIETKIKVSLANPPKSKTCEKLTIKWYIAVKDPEKSGALSLLEKTVEHVNIPLDEDIYCSIYLSPASLRRMGENAGKRAIEAVGYEILIDGTKAGVQTTKGSPDKPWWNMASEKISRSESIPLLNKTETPFYSMWWDRYAEVSKSRE